ncbi:hypothetical protein [Deinococcus pimensis]|uniref:hypothetical protein n=1 Tax=Deinococcus pimensis TaxID=309888 RepID=UPI000488827D|nr:hypothetical protein [Deinococcus pimensis]
MHASTRTGIALIAASLVKGSTYELISVGGHRTRFTGRIGPITNIYDYDRSTNIIGTFTDGTYVLHDFGATSRVTLRVHGQTFDGHDTLCGQDFTGTVRPRHVILFDDETQASYEFSLP